MLISMKWMTFNAFIPFGLTFRNWSFASAVYLKCDFSMITSSAEHLILGHILNRR